MSRDCQKVEDVFAQLNCNSKKYTKQKKGPILLLVHFWLVFSHILFLKYHFKTNKQ